MKFCKIIDGFVIQTQRSMGIDFVECPELVSCGMIKVGADYQQPPPKILTQSEIDAAKDEQVNLELDSDVIRIIIETIVTIIQDGSISIMTPGDVIAQAKANRRIEL